MRLLFLMALVLLARPAFADLYRWVDPETGSVKFSSYPPPWYGDAEKERRAPKVERIPGGRPAAEEAAETEPPPERAAALEALEARRKALLQRLAESTGQSPAELKRRVEAYQALAREVDHADPKGAEARAAEARALLEKAFGRP